MDGRIWTEINDATSNLIWLGSRIWIETLCRPEILLYLPRIFKYGIWKILLLGNLPWNHSWNMNIFTYNFGRILKLWKCKAFHWLDYCQKYEIIHKICLFIPWTLTGLCFLFCMLSGSNEDISLSIQSLAILDIA